MPNPICETQNWASGSGEGVGIAHQRDGKLRSRTPGEHVDGYAATREEALLAQVRVLKDKHDALAAASGENFNLFEILGRQTDEVRTHSAILAELLDPNGSHRQGAVFAQRFLERLDMGDVVAEDTRVRREVAIAGDSRADILIETDEACIVIENKIHAGDQPKQLERYHEYAVRSPTAKVLYLTLLGVEPSADSLGQLSVEAVTRISYKEHVVRWLDDCIKEMSRVPQIREILAHYQALLRKLTGTSTGGMNMELKELLMARQGNTYNFELAPAIAEALTALSVEAEWEFWETLKKRLLEAGPVGWRLTTVPGVGEASNPPKEVTDDVIRHAHGTGRKKWDYGWTFRIESDTKPDRYAKEGVDVLLRVECDGGGWGFYGLIAVKQTPTGKRQLQRSEERAVTVFDEWAERMSGLEEGGWRTEGEWWLAWTYPTENVDLRKSAWLAPEVIRQFRDEDRVTALVEDIQITIDAIERQGP